MPQPTCIIDCHLTDQDKLNQQISGAFVATLGVMTGVVATVKSIKEITKAEKWESFCASIGATIGAKVGLDVCILAVEGIMDSNIAWPNAYSIGAGTAIIGAGLLFGTYSGKFFKSAIDHARDYLYERNYMPVAQENLPQP